MSAGVRRRQTFSRTPQYLYSDVRYHLQPLNCHLNALAQLVSPHTATSLGAAILEDHVTRQGNEARFQNKTFFKL